MTTHIPDEIRAELEALRAQHAVALAALDRLLRAECVEPAPQDEPRWMRPKAYAAARSMSVRTVYDRIKDGMPVERVGARGVRVVVREADLWLRRYAAKHNQR